MYIHKAYPQWTKEKSFFQGYNIPETEKSGGLFSNRRIVKFFMVFCFQESARAAFIIIAHSRRFFSKSQAILWDFSTLPSYCQLFALQPPLQ